MKWRRGGKGARCKFSDLKDGEGFIHVGEAFMKTYPAKCQPHSTVSYFGGKEMLSHDTSSDKTSNAVSRFGGIYWFQDDIEVEPCPDAFWQMYE